MDEKRLKAARIFSALVCFGLVIFSVTRIDWLKLDFPRTAGLILILAFFEIWQIRYPWGRPFRLGLAVALCILAIRPLPEALLIYFVGSVLGRLIGKFDRIRKGDFYHIFQRSYLLALAGLVYLVIVSYKVPWPQPWWVHYPGPDYYGSIPNTYTNPVVLNRALVFPIAFIAMALVYYFGEVVTSAIETGMVKSGSWRMILPHHVRQTWLIYVAIAASGGLMALYFPRIPWFNFLIFLLPLFLVRAESNRDKELDVRFLQTMRVMGDAVDLARGIPGHSSRVSNLSVEVARSMGLAEDEVRELRYAAVLHDIGYAGGTPNDAARHAQRGSQVLSEIPRLRRVAEIIRFHHYEQLAEAEEGARRVPYGSKIINVVSQFDMLTSEGERKMSQEEALEELSVERGKKYDSVVLRHLSQVLERRKGVEERPRRERREKAKVLEDLETSFEEIFREDKESQ